MNKLLLALLVSVAASSAFAKDVVCTLADMQGGKAPAPCAALERPLAGVDFKKIVIDPTDSGAHLAYRGEKWGVCYARSYKSITECAKFAPAFEAGAASVQYRRDSVASK